MKISFDLDDTIISNNRFPLEKETFWAKIIGCERIRSGTVTLFKALRDRKHTIYIYTTSYRSTLKIKLMFLSYSIPVDFIINQQLHDRKVKKKGKNISKFPPEFGIDIHIDDSAGVEIEGKKFGFKTIIISPDEVDWSNIILKKIDEFRMRYE
ncbi:HAD family hydrolase [Chryseobacterium mucoviscidosis]|uniref:HAD family hydrolase n=1 Tax=Chryseobacterium mucoviscidosis TaxID=1945581 RepID=UPI00301866F6